jgi:hypothetical protein
MGMFSNKLESFPLCQAVVSFRKRILRGWLKDVRDQDHKKLAFCVSVENSGLFGMLETMGNVTNRIARELYFAFAKYPAR